MSIGQSMCRYQLDVLKVLFSLKKMSLNMSEKWRPFCLGLDVLISYMASDKTVWPKEIKHYEEKVTM